MMYNLFVAYGLMLLFSNIEANSFGGRIINGTNAEPGELPYIVSFRSSSGSHKCGGTIINQNWILTAAQCIWVTVLDTIQFGVVDISVNGSNIIPVDYAIWYDQYNASTKENDIALLRLTKPIKFDQYAKPVVLPLQDQNFPDFSKAILAGWGYNDTEGDVVSALQKVDLITYNHMTCSDMYRREIFETNLCAGFPGTIKGQCNGDSGGPLTVNGVQVGIASWSMKPCGTFPYPEVYTRVSSYVDWINSKTK